MKRYIAVLVALFACQQVTAEPIELAVPGQKWVVKFRGPAMRQIESPLDTDGHVYTGNAGKLNLSLHVHQPDCDGGDSSDNLFKCFVAKVQRNPFLMKDVQIKRRDESDGVFITYLLEAPAGARSVQAFNVNFLFARAGKWGDLHVSVVNFTKSDLDMVTTLLNTLEIVER